MYADMQSKTCNMRFDLCHSWFDSHHIVVWVGQLRKLLVYSSIVNQVCTYIHPLLISIFG